MYQVVLEYQIASILVIIISMKKLKVALVHDDLVQWGGAERVLAGISKILPDAFVYTSVFDSRNRNIISNIDPKRIRVSFMQKIPFWRHFYRAMVFLYPLAFESFDFREYDLVISQTTRFAKNIVTGEDTLHICYCHTPPRFLWGFSNHKLTPGWMLPFASIGRLIDQSSALRVDKWLAGSKNCQKRLQKIYKVDSKVLYPFVEDKFFKTRKIEDKGYLLVVARLIGYKKVDEVIRACMRLKIGLTVVGSGPMKGELVGMSNKKITFIEGVDDKKLIELIANCKAVVIPAEEDFGLVSIEAQALGKGVIAYRGGGSLESVIDGVTGVFFDSQRSEDIARAIIRFRTLKLSPQKIRKNARRFRRAIFEKQFIDTLAKFGYSFS